VTRELRLDGAGTRAVTDAERRGGTGVEGVRHLYLHLPFCAHRCGYCDFVTVVGQDELQSRYVDALVRELELEGGVLARDVNTVFLGGGTPTLTRPEALARLLAELPRAQEVTVEANPETVTPELAELLRANGVNRISLGAQTFERRLLSVLERRATPQDVRRSVAVVRAAGFDNVSLDLLYGIPGQTREDLDRDLDEALALEPEHLSCYELEAKPGTRFTHAHGAELERQGEAMEGYFECVVDRLTGAGYRWYETANFCLRPDRADGRDLRARHNLGYWQARDYLGLGIGAVSTVGGERRRNLPSIARYVGALAAGERPPRELEPIDDLTSERERLLLGLRLDEPVALTGAEEAIDKASLARLVAGRLVTRSANGRGDEIALTERGRFLGGAVTAELIAW
jgi:oxygen-independent coproporphyrinogen III oxidase